MFKINPGMLGVTAVGLIIANPAVAATLAAPAQSRSSDYLLAVSAVSAPSGITQWSSGTINVRRQSPLLVLGSTSGAPEPPSTTQPSSGTIDGRRQSPLLVVPHDIVPAVPEPATWALMILGFGMVGFTLRRRRRADVRNGDICGQARLRAASPMF